MKFLKLTAGLLMIGSILAEQRPNIIFILADDLGYGDIGVLWQNKKKGDKKIKTPYFDKMAEDGMILNRHYCPAPVCAPSRASLLSGLHQGHANIRDNQFDKAIEDNYNLANVLQKAGYFTAIIGKYGLQGLKGNSPEAWKAYPTKRGFDYFFGYVAHKDGHTHYPNHRTTKHTSPLYDQDVNIAADLSKCFTPDLFTARAKKLIYDEVNDGDKQPFFLYLAYDTPHSSLQLPTVAYPGIDPESPTDDSGLGINGGVQWLGKPGKMINTAVGKINSYRHPDHTVNLTKKWSDSEERQAGLVRRMDDNIGDLRKTLKDLGIEKNTLIIFSSDNGPHDKSYPAKATRDRVRYTAAAFESFGPFEGIKRDCWEGGIREPTFAVWPGTIAKDTRSEQISQFQDWLPTFCDIAKIAHPARTDGVSLLPTLSGKGKQRQTTTYIEYSGHKATPKYPQFANHGETSREQAQVIFLDKYKGIRINPKNARSDFEIYDVSTDFKEAKNLAKSSDYFKKLNKRMKDRVLQVRMPDESAQRPWDNALIPSLKTLPELKEGLEITTYEGDWEWLPEFTQLDAKDSHIAADLTASKEKLSDFIGGVLYKGFIKVPTSGKWKISLQSNSSSLLRIHDIKTIDNDYNHTSKMISVSMNLEAGYHPIRLYTTTDAENKPFVSLKWQSEGSTDKEAVTFYHLKSQ